MSSKLVKCKTCGAEITASAKTCPYCKSKNIVIHPIRAAIAGIIGLIFCAVLFHGFLGTDAFKSGIPASQQLSASSENKTIQTIVDKDGVKITYTGMELVQYSPSQSDAYMLSVGIVVENNSGVDITVLPVDSSVNDVMKIAVSGMPISVTDGKKSNTGFSFANLDGTGITPPSMDNVQNIEFCLSVENSNTYEDLFKSDVITVHP